MDNMKGVSKMSKSEKRKGKSKMWIIVVVAILGVAMLGGILADAPGRNEIKELTFPNLKFKNLRDGTFVGEYKGTKSHFRDAKVEITVLEGEISDIKILKGAMDKDGKPLKLTGGRSVDDLFNNAIQSQTLEVDVVSGATITSKAHLKALENALEQAQPEK